MTIITAGPPAVRENLLGVCAAIGDSTGIPALAVRLAFIVAMLGISLEATIAAYLGLGLAIVAADLAGRLADRSSGRR